jgi:hypothetical protein
MNETVLNKLERRLGGLHARQRLGIETDHEAQIFGQGINFFHIENWYSIHSVIRTALKLLGLYSRGLKNAEQIQVRHNHVRSKMLPNQFDGFTLLHISDLHADISQGAMRRLNEILPDLTYDMCVLTGDYRGATFGPFDAALEGLARARAHLRGQSTAYWEITIRFAWFPNSKKWEFGYCSTNASPFRALMKRFT